MSSDKQVKVEPIAIVGMSCRFPGDCNTPEDFWKFLIEGRDAVGEIPKDRFDVDRYYGASPEADYKIKSRWGGMIRHHDFFDAEFFGMAAREVERTDPQQRILLEDVWTALEYAGVSPGSLRQSNTGVYIGVCSPDYVQERVKEKAHREKYKYFCSGTHLSVVAGRISFLLDLQGPCISVNTACSSSLVAAHLACQALRNQECDMALAGGVNLFFSPDTMVNLSKDEFLSPTGKCHTFDEKADGFTRGEGSGVLVLKRLSDALREGYTIHAVILGSAINHDGRSNTLTSPNGIAQEKVIRQALHVAGVEPSDVNYVETHGTGTPLGDPIEMGALAAVLTPGRKVREPLVVGGVKSGIGHLEAAAGIAGVIKTVMALRNKVIPPQVNFHQLNPHISLEKNLIRVADEKISWEGAKRVAGVSGFSFSGTNAHLIISDESTHTEKQLKAGSDGHHVLFLSARSPEALRQYQKKYLEFLTENKGLAPENLIYTANVGRSHFASRNAILFSDMNDLVAKMHRLGQDNGSLDILTSISGDEGKSGLTFVFPDDFENKSAVGAGLIAEYEAFNEFVKAVDNLLRDLLPLSLHDFLNGGVRAGEFRSDETLELISLFILQWGKAQLLARGGGAPVRVLASGHGHYAAAVVAGVLTLEDALGLIMGRHLSGLARQVRLASPKVEYGDLPSCGAVEITEPGFWEKLTQFQSQHPDHAVKSLPATFVTADLSRDSMEMILAKIYCAGIDLNWSQFHRPAKRVPLPTYPFQRKQFSYLLDKETGLDAEGKDNLPPAKVEDILKNPRAQIKTRIIEVLKISSDLRDDMGLAEMGLDSPMAVEIRSLLERDFEIKLPATLLFECQTVNELAKFVETALETAAKKEAV